MQEYKERAAEQGVQQNINAPMQANKFSDMIADMFGGGKKAPENREKAQEMMNA